MRSAVMVMGLVDAVSSKTELVGTVPVLIAKPACRRKLASGFCFLASAKRSSKPFFPPVLPSRSASARSIASTSLTEPWVMGSIVQELASAAARLALTN